MKYAEVMYSLENQATPRKREALKDLKKKSKALKVKEIRKKNQMRLQKKKHVRDLSSHLKKRSITHVNAMNKRNIRKNAIKP